MSKKQSSKKQAASQPSHRADQAYDDEWHWVGNKMSIEERARRYPSRFIVPASYSSLPGYKSPDNQTIDESMAWVANLKWIAHEHYHAVECKEDGRINLGDVVALNADDVAEYFIRVDELFEDPDGEMMFSGQFFYQPQETVMGHWIPLKKGQDDQREPTGKTVQVPQLKGRLFLAADEDNKTYNTVHNLNAVNRVVTVHRVKPGGAIPDLTDDSEYWFDQIHSVNHYVFRDYYEEGEEPEFIKMPATTTLRVLELCSGAGGTSFLCQKATMNGKTIDLKSSWAIDIAEDANATYVINDPECFVYNTGIDEALMLSKIWETDVLSRWGPSIKVPATRASGQIKEIIDVQLCDEAVRGKSGQGLGHLLGNLEREQCWVEFLCVMHAPAADGQEIAKWIKITEIPPCDREIRAFVATERSQRRIPVRGDVDIIMGGPPCQGLSGLNRNAARIDILKDPKNRLVMVYYDIVKWFQPKFTIMEQVLDCFKKENALYARFMASAITALRYQCRIGIIAAGDHGCPQGRYRVITWSAKQGMPLPQFPEPSHRCLDFKTPVPEVAKASMVGFKSIESLKAAYPMNLNADVLEDLPKISNYSFSDGSIYASDPKRPWQLFMRRSPPATSLSSANARAKSACMIMRNTDVLKYLNLLSLYDEGSSKLGFEFFCGKRPVPNSQLTNEDVCETEDEVEEEDEGQGEEEEEEQQPTARKGGEDEEDENEPAALGATEIKAESNFARATWRAYLMTIKDPAKRVLVNNAKIAAANAYAAEMGDVICEEFKEAIGATLRTMALTDNDEELRDHRPLNNNFDDYERMAAVPKFKGASFRNMPGVVVNENGSTCAGHCHAYSSTNLSGDASKASTSAQANAKQPKVGCAGGGTIKALVRSTDKMSRIDQHDKHGWRGTHLPLCPACTHWLTSGDLVCPRWCITYQGGKSGKAGSRQSCFGRVWYDEIQPTVVTRSEPHNLRIVHPTEDRVLSIRENARCQGFPDYWAFVGLDSGKNSGSNRSGSVPSRYAQIGNAVAPPVARKIGLALIYSLTIDPAKATFHGTKEDESVVAVRDPEMDQAYNEARRLGLKSYSEEHGQDQKELKERIARFEDKEKLRNTVARAEVAISDNLRSIGAILPTEALSQTAPKRAGAASTSKVQPSPAAQKRSAAEMEEDKEKQANGRGKRVKRG